MNVNNSDSKFVDTNLINGGYESVKLTRDEQIRIAALNACISYFHDKEVPWDCFIDNLQYLENYIREGIKQNETNATNSDNVADSTNRDSSGTPR